jgi:hypothetical protein
MTPMVEVTRPRSIPLSLATEIAKITAKATGGKGGAGLIDTEAMVAADTAAAHLVDQLEKQNEHLDMQLQTFGLLVGAAEKLRLTSEATKAGIFSPANAKMIDDTAAKTQRLADLTESRRAFDETRTPAESTAKRFADLERLGLDNDTMLREAGKLAATLGLGGAGSASPGALIRGSAADRSFNISQDRAGSRGNAVQQLTDIMKNAAADAAGQRAIQQQILDFFRGGGLEVANIQ